jgi:hypothetical protein
MGRVSQKNQFQNSRGEIMKVRMLAVLSALSLALWLPLRAQQAPSAQTPQTPPPAASENSGKPADKQECCCAAKAQAGKDAVSHNHHGMACCHGKNANAAKASCCEGNDSKQVSCCAKGEKTVKQCCAEMQDGPCAAKDGKGCCAGVSSQCPAHAETKS